MSTLAIAEALEEITRRLVAELHPEQVILFGSHAWGVPHEDSDLDLLIILAASEESPHRRAVRAHRALRGIPVPCDILVKTQAEIQGINPVRSSLLYRALTEGRPLLGHA
jgi:predicted nucleotidyltransferase